MKLLKCRLLLENKKLVTFGKNRILLVVSYSENKPSANYELVREGEGWIKGAIKENQNY